MSTTAATPVAYHLVVRAPYPLVPYSDRRRRQEDWSRLQRTFPRCIAAVLMPDHVHLVLGVEAGSPDVLWRRFQRLYRGKQWQEVPEPQAIPDKHHLLRQVRYVHLNPCRKKLCIDPLNWMWSTHRNYLGATVNPWPQVERWLVALGFGSGDRARERFHAYVSGDPSVHPLGTAAPVHPKGAIAFALSDMEKAAVVAARVDAQAFRRKGPARAWLMSLLVKEMGVPAREVARYFDVHHSAASFRRSRHRHRGVKAAAAVMAVRMVLCDRRLLSPADF